MTVLRFANLRDFVIPSLSCSETSVTTDLRHEKILHERIAQ